MTTHAINTPAGPLAAGEQAPDFVVIDHKGDTVRLSDFQGKRAVVLFFYPKDDSPSCRREACSFRDQYAAFQDAGAEVIGINGDSAKSHQAFAEKRSLSYRLLTDIGGKVRKLYGVPALLGLFTHRVTFVIDRDGVIRHVVNSQAGSQRHVSEALATVKRISAGE